MAQLRQNRRLLDAGDVSVLIVSFESSRAIARYASDPELPGPVVSDPDRELYRTYGMDRATLFDVWGPRTWCAYAKAMARGTLPERASADTRQRGGDVLIDPKSIVRMHHIGKGPADRPDIATLLAVVRANSMEPRRP